jgi:hypothetical protein
VVLRVCVLILGLQGEGIGRYHFLFIVPAYGGHQNTSVQPASYIHTLSLSGADNPSSRYHPPRFCLWTRSRLVLYKTGKTLISEPIFSLSQVAITLVYRYLPLSDKQGIIGNWPTWRMFGIRGYVGSDISPYPEQTPSFVEHVPQRWNNSTDALNAGGLLSTRPQTRIPFVETHLTSKATFVVRKEAPQRVAAARRPFPGALKWQASDRAVRTAGPRKLLVA